MATLKVQYKCPITGENTEAICETCVDVNAKVFVIVNECPVCGEDHNINI